MSLNTCFDWFNKLMLYSYVLNLKIDVVPKASGAVVIRGYFNLFPIICLILKKNYTFFNIIAKKV